VLERLEAETPREFEELWELIRESSNARTEARGTERAKQPETL